MPYLVAVALAALTCVFGYNLPYYKAQDFYGVLLVLAAGSYVGFAIHDGRRHLMILELVVALGFCALVLLGMWWKDIVLAFGFLLQIVWHLLHFLFRRVSRVKSWYPLSGALYSAIVGAYIYFYLFQ